MATETCPLCEWTCDEKDSAQAARNSVRSHMSSKVDDDHRGVGYQKATQLLDIQEADIQDATASAPQPSASAGALGDTDDGRDAVRADGGGLGLEGKPDVDPSDATDDDDGDRDEELACTGCDDPLGVTADELEADPDIEPGDVLVCECGQQMEYNP